MTKYLPDALGRLVEHVKVGSGADYIRNLTTYDDWTGVDGRAKATRTQDLPAPQDDRVTITHYDFAGRPFILQNPGSPAEPALGSPQPFSTYVEYDAASRAKRILDGMGRDILLHRNGRGQLLLRELVTALGDVADGATYVSATHEFYQRNPLGQVIRTESWQGDPQNSGVFLNQVEFEVDSLGRTHSEGFTFGGAHPGAHPVLSSWGSDPDFRAGLSYSSGLSLAFTPDDIGRLAQVDLDVTGSTSRVLAEYGFFGSRVSDRQLHYNDDPSPDIGTTQNFFDVYGRHEKLQHSALTAALPTFEYGYDAASNLISEKYDKAAGTAAGVGDTFAYDAYNRLSSAKLGVDDVTTPTTFVRELTYGLDHGGNRTQVVDDDGATPVTTNYTAQEAAHAQGASNRYATVGAQSYVYDGNGNLIFDGTYSYRYDLHNRLAEVWLVVQDTQQQQQSSGGGVLSLQKSSWSANDYEAIVDARKAALKLAPGLSALVQNTENVSVSAPLQPSGGSSKSGTSQQSSSQQLVLVAAYAYDGYHRRLVRILAGIDTYLSTYDGWRETEELIVGVSANVVDKQFVWGRGLNEMLAYLKADGQGGYDEYFVHGGGQDSVMRVVDSDGNLVEGIDYDPYGQPTYYDLSGANPTTTPNNLSVIENPYAWKGHRRDWETGLVYMRHRYYSASLGRFMTLDPIGGLG